MVSSASLRVEGRFRRIVLGAGGSADVSGGMLVVGCLAVVETGGSISSSTIRDVGILDTAMCLMTVGASVMSLLPLAACSTRGITAGSGGLAVTVDVGGRFTCDVAGRFRRIVCGIGPGCMGMPKMGPVVRLKSVGLLGAADSAGPIREVCRLTVSAVVVRTLVGTCTRAVSPGFFYRWRHVNGLYRDWRCGGAFSGEWFAE